jgi:hypothetical protein
VVNTNVSFYDFATSKNFELIPELPGTYFVYNLFRPEFKKIY